MEMRKLALELAVRHLSKDARNLETVFQWANDFYEWLTQDGKPSAEVMHVHLVAPQKPFGGKDMVNKKELRETMRLRLKSAQDTHWYNIDKQVGYTEALEDVLRIIDEL